MINKSAPLLTIFVLQCFVVSLCAAYPYVIVPEYELQSGSHSANQDDVRHLQKRAFDRVDYADFGFVKRSVVKRAFDRVDLADFGLRRKRAFDRVGRADFGLLRRKRAFDRVADAGFGLMKRSVPLGDRESLVDDLASSIAALRRIRSVEKSAGPLVDDSILLAAEDN